MKTTHYLLSLLLLTFCFACNPTEPDQAETDSSAVNATDTSSTESTTTNEIETAPAKEKGSTSTKENGGAVTKDKSSKSKNLQLTAKFVDFSLGDASHYVFQDKTGKTWDFGDCDDEEHVFIKELPKSQANETNQGFGPNPKLVGKWFELTYTYRYQPIYQDGPDGDVPVILVAKLLD